MTTMTRRTFIIAGTGAIAGGSSAFAPMLAAVGESALQFGASPAGDRDCVCLIERMSEEGVWVPSAQLRRPSELNGPIVRGAEGRWYLSGAERVSFIHSDVQVRVERRIAMRSDGSHCARKDA